MKAALAAQRILATSRPDEAAPAAQQDEREACAQICEKYAKANMESDIMVEAFLHCAEAIRKSGT